jgi:hypothetical protein
MNSYIIFKALEKVEDCCNKKLISRPNSEIRKVLQNIGKCREKNKLHNCGDCETIHYCQKIEKLLELIDDVCFECKLRNGCRLFENLSMAVKVLI